MPAPSVIAAPVVSVAGQDVTPSGAKTLAGWPVAALTSVTVAPFTDAPLSLSNT